MCGCYAQLNAEDIAALGVDVVSGSAGREEFVQRLLQKLRDRTQGAQIQVDEALKRRRFEVLPAGGLAERTRAMLKVQDGCNNFCTYCIIPYARGRVRSMPLQAAVEQAKGLAAEGYREIVINGIEISSWGWEWKDGSCLRQLLAALCAAVPAVRIRLGSLEPRTIDEDFCKTLCVYPNLCPQFHLSLQSGSDTVLQRMHRRYDTARYLESVRLLRQYFPGCAVTTETSDIDLLVRVDTAQFDRAAARDLLGALRRLGRRVDAVLETPNGWTALAEYASDAPEFLQKTRDGCRLTDRL